MNRPVEHLDDDELVNLCGALRWEPEVWLTHLDRCEGCRGALGELALVHGAFAPVPVPERLAARLEGALAAARERDRAAPARRLARTAPAVLVAATAFAALAVFGGINPLSAGAGLIPAALLAGLAAAVSVRPPAPGSAAGRLLAAL